MPINTGNSLSAASYNSIRSILYSLITTKYAYISPTPTNTVSAGEKIVLEDWRRLYIDINRCKVHQTNSIISGISEPQVGQVITAAFANTLLTEVTSLNSTYDTVSLSQLASQVVTDTRTSVWDNSSGGISTTIDVQFNSSSELNLFLDLGGRCSVDISYPSGSYTGVDATWKTLIDNINTALTAQGAFKKGSSESPIVVQTVGVGYIEVRFSKTSTKISISIDFVITAGGVVTVNILPTVNYRVFNSSNTLGPVPYGIPGPAYSTSGLGLNNVPPVPLISKILSVSPGSLSYNFPAYTTSAISTLTINNVGTGPVTVTAVETPSQSFLVPEIGVGSTLVIGSAIAPSTSKTLQLSYQSTSAATGTYNTEVRLVSDNQSGVITIPVSLTVTDPQFSISLSPVNWIYTATNLNVAQQTFSIVPSPGTQVQSYSATIEDFLNVGSYIGFNASTLTVSFDPKNIANGNYVSTLTVVANYLVYQSTSSVTMNFTKNIAAVETKNLGSWISAQSAANSVLGISYDLIANQRYITIGFGAGADGGPIVASGGSSYVSEANLGITSDQNYNSGPALFKSDSDGAYTQFLNTYGVRVRSESFEPINVEQVRSYTVNVVTAGVYDWTFAADDNGYFAIDGVIVSDRRIIEIGIDNDNDGVIDQIQIVSNSNAYTTNETGSISLSAGQHTITIGYTNFDGPGAVALRLVLATSPFTELWSTLTPIRPTIPYSFWAEVYRIPLTGSAQTYKPSDYPVKNGGYASGLTYASEMSSGDFCTVQDDGNGNISVNFDPSARTVNGQYISTTANANRYLPWYYINISDITRIQQLETPTGSTTRFFLGFDRNGTVLTSSGTIPTSNGNTGGGYEPRPNPLVKER